MISTTQWRNNLSVCMVTKALIYNMMLDVLYVWQNNKCSDAMVTQVYSAHVPVQ